MCYQPIQIKNVKFGQPGEPEYLMVNCRKCLECRQKRAREWALRCWSECKAYKCNSFITLTYAVSPVWLQKRHLQLFFKRLRKALPGVKLKYFACGEYGSAEYTSRPHYHAIIFGYDFPDRFLWSKSKRGNAIFRSPLLEKLWTYGNSTVQDVSYDSCAYTALYSSPQVHEMPAHLRHVPEFNLMSKNLGTSFLLSNMEHYLETDQIYIDGVQHSIPQYLLNKFFGTGVQRDYDFRYVSLKRKRAEKFTKSISWLDADKFTKEQLWETPLSQRKLIRENANKRLQKVY